MLKAGTFRVDVLQDPDSYAMTQPLHPWYQQTLYCIGGDEWVQAGDGTSIKVWRCQERVWEVEEKPWKDALGSAFPLAVATTNVRSLQCAEIPNTSKTIVKQWDADTVDELEIVMLTTAPSFYCIDEVL